MSESGEKALSDAWKLASHVQTQNLHLHEIDPQQRKEKRREVLQRGEEVIGLLSAIQKKKLPLQESVAAFEKASELLVHPDAQKVAEYLYDNLQSTFEEVGIHHAAFIPVGSSAQGGMFLRELAGTLHPTPEHPADIDLRMICDNPHLLSIETFVMIRQRIEELMGNPTDPTLPLGYRVDLLRNIDPRGDRRMESPLANIETAHPTVILPSGRSVVGVDGIVSDLSTKAGDMSAFHAALCFAPSYPAEVNAHNRELLLGGLEKLSKESPAGWRQAVHSLISAYNTVANSPKEKYFLAGGDEHTIPQQEYNAFRDDYNKVYNGIQNLRDDVFASLLRKTNRRKSLFRRFLG